MSTIPSIIPLGHALDKVSKTHSAPADHSFSSSRYGDPRGSFSIDDNDHETSPTATSIFLSTAIHVCLQKWLEGIFLTFFHIIPSHTDEVYDDPVIFLRDCLVFTYIINTTTLKSWKFFCCCWFSHSILHSYNSWGQSNYQKNSNAHNHDQ